MEIWTQNYKSNKTYTNQMSYHNLIKKAIFPEIMLHELHVLHASHVLHAFHAHQILCGSPI